MGGSVEYMDVVDNLLMSVHTLQRFMKSCYEEPTKVRSTAFLLYKINEATCSIFSVSLSE